MRIDMTSLAEEIVAVLVLAKKAGLPNGPSNPKDPDVVKIYLATLATNQVEAEMLREARPAIFGSETFFPTPAALVKHCEPIRDRVLEARRRAYLASLVECRDDGGVLVLAEPCRVRRGRLLPPGDRSGDGSSMPALPDPSDRGRGLAAKILAEARGVE